MLIDVYLWLNPLNKKRFCEATCSGGTGSIHVIGAVEREHKHWQDSENLSRLWFYLCTVFNSKSVSQMACQEKDTESLKSLQTELWWAFENINFHDVMRIKQQLHCFSGLSVNIYHIFAGFFPLRPLLTAEQNHLLHLVVQERITPSGQGI